MASFKTLVYLLTIIECIWWIWWSVLFLHLHSDSLSSREAVFCLLFFLTDGKYFGVPSVLCYQCFLLTRGFQTIEPSEL